MSMNKHEQDVVATAARNLIETGMLLASLAQGTGVIQPPVVTPPQAAPIQAAPRAPMTGAILGLVPNGACHAPGCTKREGLMTNVFCRKHKAFRTGEVPVTTVPQAIRVQAAAPAKPSNKGRKGANCSECGTFMTKVRIQAGHTACENCFDMPRTQAAPLDHLLMGVPVTQAQFDAFVAAVGVESLAVGDGSLV